MLTFVTVPNSVQIHLQIRRAKHCFQGDTDELEKQNTNPLQNGGFPLQLLDFFSFPSSLSIHLTASYS